MNVQKQKGGARTEGREGAGSGWARGAGLHALWRTDRAEGSESPCPNPLGLHVNALFPDFVLRRTLWFPAPLFLFVCALSSHTLPL